MGAALGKSPEIGGIHINYEGQWLIPGLSTEDRWWPNKFVAWESVQCVWRAAALQASASDHRTRWILEKSPSNIVRAEKLLEIFPNSRAVVSTRSPLPTVISQAARYDHPLYQGVSREDILRYLTHLWITMAEHLDHITKNHPADTLTYEQFCSEPHSLFRAFQLEHCAPVSGEKITVNVKGRGDQEIQNQNDRQIASASTTDRRIICDELRKRSDMLRRFGYEEILDHP